MAKQHKKRHSTSLTTGEMRIKPTVRAHFSSARYLNRKEVPVRAWRMREPGASLSLVQC